MCLAGQVLDIYLDDGRFLEHGRGDVVWAVVAVFFEDAQQGFFFFVRVRDDGGRSASADAAVKVRPVAGTLTRADARKRDCAERDSRACVQAVDFLAGRRAVYEELHVMIAVCPPAKVDGHGVWSAAVYQRERQKCRPVQYLADAGKVRDFPVFPAHGGSIARRAEQC